VSRAQLQPDEVFCSAIERTSPGERAAYLDQVCADDAELRRRVERLLEAHAHAGSFLAAGPPGTPATADAPVEAVGTVIGPYHLLEQIGEGGFGVVFMAEQHEPIRRKVALKLLKPGMDSKHVIARFEAERQALALMDHASIAKVLDGGQTSGRPYFVMDLVKGLPITEYCDQGQLTTRERLELFLHVCQAVQHAHQKGIIHRDLKPSNVLVTVQDGRALVKVIDFGIAKALGQQLTDKTLFTGFAQLVGTPLYMSPEQAALSNVDVDTRSDVYSLGVLLYELLTGTTPFDKDRLKHLDYDELRRIIREEEPPRPSTRISTLGQAAITVSTQRKSDPKRLRQLFRGELDWIVMKCLEKDRDRRYDTASALAADVQCYLRDEPVLACRPSGLYRLRKFLRRNRTALTIAGLMAFCVLLPVGVFAWAAWDQTARELEAELNRAAQQAATDRQVSQALDEAEGLQRQKNWPKALEAAKRAQGFAAGGASEARRQRAAELRRDVEMVLRLQEIWFPRTLERTDSAVTDAAYATAFRDYDMDLTSLEPAEAARRLRSRETWLELTVALDHWARVRTDLSGRPPKIDDPLRKRLLAVARVADPDPWRNQVRDALEPRDGAKLRQLAASPEVANQQLQTLSLLGWALDSAGAGKEAVAVLRLAQQRFPDDFEINFQLGWALDHGPPFAQRADEVIRFYTVARSLRPRNFQVHLILGSKLTSRRNWEEAIAVFERAIELKPDDATAYAGLAGALGGQNRFDESIAMYHKAINLRSKTSVTGRDQADMLIWMHNLAMTYKSAGQLDKALPVFERTLEKQRTKLGPSHRDTLSTLNRLADAYNAAGLFDQAEPLLRESLQQWRKKDGSASPAAASMLALLGWNLLQQQKYAEAEPLLRESLEIRVQKTPNLWPTFHTRSMLGAALLGQKKYAEAEPLLLEGYQQMKQREAGMPNPSRPHLTEALQWLVRLYEATGRKDQADAWLKKHEQPPPAQKRPQLQ
jgi:serine/threonine protein kinase/tetratricopeptide (TPR) repeat protein